jgi:hypothetical protein
VFSATSDGPRLETSKPEIDLVLNETHQFLKVARKRVNGEAESLAESTINRENDIESNEVHHFTRADEDFPHLVNFPYIAEVSSQCKRQADGGTGPLLKNFSGVTTPSCLKIMPFFITKRTSRSASMFSKGLFETAIKSAGRPIFMGPR